MSDVAERVKKIVVEHLGVDGGMVKAEASLTRVPAGRPRRHRRDRTLSRLA